MDESPKQSSLAKLVLISSFSTVVIVFAVLYIFRNPLAEFLLQNISLPKPSTTESAAYNEDSLVDMIAIANTAVVSVVATQGSEVNAGSGFIVSNDGLIVTNNHVVKDVDASYAVVLTDGTFYTVDIFARDPDLDLAILKINQPLQKALTYLDFGDSTQIKLGQTVVAIGNVLAEFQNLVSVGVVSGLSRSILASDKWGRSEQLDKVIQTDVAINLGNSGGPLLNKDGEVIGVNVAASRGVDSISFALPAEQVEQAVESVKKHGKIVRPFLGVRYTFVTPHLAKSNNLPVEYGALVIRGSNADESAVIVGSPAEKAGLLENDIIIAVDDTDLKDVELSKILRTKSVGQTITLKVISGGKEKTILIKLDQAI
jgi:serine protease Do